MVLPGFSVLLFRQSSMAATLFHILKTISYCLLPPRHMLHVETKKNIRAVMKA